MVPGQASSIGSSASPIASVDDTIWTCTNVFGGGALHVFNKPTRAQLAQALSNPSNPNAWHLMTHRYGARRWELWTDFKPDTNTPPTSVRSKDCPPWQMNCQKVAGQWDGIVGQYDQTAPRPVRVPEPGENINIGFSTVRGIKQMPNGKVLVTISHDYGGAFCRRGHVYIDSGDVIAAQCTEIKQVRLPNDYQYLSGQNVLGATHGCHAGWTAGLMAVIPDAWRPEFGNMTAWCGNAGQSVTSRCYSGPSAICFDHNDLLNNTETTGKVAVAVAEVSEGARWTWPYETAPFVPYGNAGIYRSSDRTISSLTGPPTPEAPGKITRIYGYMRSQGAFIPIPGTRTVICVMSGPARDCAVIYGSTGIDASDGLVHGIKNPDAGPWYRQVVDCRARAMDGELGPRAPQLNFAAGGTGSLAAFVGGTGVIDRRIEFYDAALFAQKFATMQANGHSDAVASTYRPSHVDTLPCIMAMPSEYWSTGKMLTTPSADYDPVEKILWVSHPYMHNTGAALPILEAYDVAIPNATVVPADRYGNVRSRKSFSKFHW